MDMAHKAELDLIAAIARDQDRLMARRMVWLIEQTRAGKDIAICEWDDGLKAYVLALWPTQLIDREMAKPSDEELAAEARWTASWDKQHAPVLR